MTVEIVNKLVLEFSNFIETTKRQIDDEIREYGWQDDHILITPDLLETVGFFLGVGDHYGECIGLGCGRKIWSEFVSCEHDKGRWVSYNEKTDTIRVEIL